MKCPKCGYLGFERVERCRNCGYDFPAQSVQEMPELPLRGIDNPAPLPDYDLSDRPAPSVRAGEPRLSRAADELPLFGAIVPDVRMPGHTPPPRPPLSVRRATTDGRRARVDEGRAPLLDISGSEAEVAPPPHVRSPRDRGPLPTSSSTAAETADAAGTGTRLAAGAVDLLLLAAIDVAVVSLTLQICGLTMQELDVVPAVPLLAFLLLQNGGYLAAFTAAGQTIGKMAFGLRVVPAGGGSRVEPGRAAIRTLVWGLMALPAGLGFASVLLDRDRRGWHDHAAGTSVIRSSEA